MEAYAPAQVQFGTGGPNDPKLLMSLTELQQELVGLELLRAEELEREIHEGHYHNGRSAVVQVLARKPT